MVLRAVSLLLTQFLLLEALEDLETAALTVYRNPDFFGHLRPGFDSHGNLQDFRTHDFFGSFSEDFFQQDSPFNVYKPPQRSNQEEDSGADDASDDSGGGGDGGDGGDGENDDDGQDSGNNEEDEGDLNEEQEEGGEEENEEDNNEPPTKRYKYPGETKKPNPPGRPDVNVHYDDSPDFHHPSRNVPPPTRPKKGRGPYGHPRYDDEDSNIERKNVVGDVDFQSQREGTQQYPVQGHEEDGHEEIYRPEGTRDFIETKKGTREYLKHHRLPAHHEAPQVDHSINERKFKYKIWLPKKKYVYRIRPVYSRYRVIPLKRRKSKKVFIIQPVYQKRSINEVEDDSAYLNNSELDGQYQLKTY